MGDIKKYLIKLLKRPKNTIVAQFPLLRLSLRMFHFPLM
jgi:hypothetical protein